MAKKIIYYDGECGLCHGAVKFILGIDSKNKFHFSPISNLIDNGNEIDSIILKMNDDTFYEENVGWKMSGIELKKIIQKLLLTKIYIGTDQINQSEYSEYQPKSKR